MAHTPGDACQVAMQRSIMATSYPAMAESAPTLPSCPPAVGTTIFFSGISPTPAATGHGTPGQKPRARLVLRRPLTPGNADSVIALTLRRRECDSPLSRFTDRSHCLSFDFEVALLHHPLPLGDVLLSRTRELFRSSVCRLIAAGAQPLHYLWLLQNARER